MAEQFLEDIYREAYIIEDLREVLYFLRVSDLRNSRILYNRTAEKLETLISDIAMNDIMLANKIQDIAVEVMDNWNDHHLAAETIEASLIPAMFEYMSNYADIDVEENSLKLKSAKSGFLTLKDLNRDHFYHDTFDPMWEAHEKAVLLYEADMEDYYLFGSGLGYLAYQLWLLSNQAMKIHIYEDNPTITEYAKHYGVLSWIDPQCLEIIQNNSKEYISNRFLNDVNSCRSKHGKYIPRYYAEQYKDINNGTLTRAILFDDTNRDFANLVTVNIWKNSRQKQSDYDTLRNSLTSKEWIVVAAGPSLDTSMDFIRANAGKCSVVIVNTVIRKFATSGITADLAVVADPTNGLVDHVAGVEDYTANIPLLATSSANWKFVSLFKGPKTFVAASAYNSLSQNKYKAIPVWNLGGTVSNLAIEAALHFGAKTIHLIGLDLAYPEGLTYATDLPHERTNAGEITLFVPSTDGRQVGTNEVFNIFRESIEIQIAEHRDVCFINHSPNGAMIKGTVSPH